MPLFLFGKKREEAVCPRCGGPRSVTMQFCTECTLAVKQGAPPGPGAPPRDPYAPSGRQPSYGGGADPLPWTRGQQQAPHEAPPRGGRGRGPTPFPPMPQSGDPGPGAPTPAGAGQQAQPASIRAKQGVYVRTPAERDVADFLWDNGILFGYDQEIVGRRVSFVLPGKEIVIETWPDRERDESLRGLGFAIIVPGGNVREDLKRGLMAKFPGKVWK